MTVEGSLLDRHARPLGVLRLSLTGRCNLSCPYCCPDADEPSGLLTLEQQLALVRATCRLGVTTLRLTGGEPLLSERLWPLLEAIAAARRTSGDPMRELHDVTLTTNGVLLTAERATRLRALGVDRITISLDGAEARSVARMAGLRGGVRAGQQLLEQVLAGVVAARDAGFSPRQGALKLNSVIQLGANDDQVLPLAALARDLGLELRLIEYMDVGNRNGWTPSQVMPAAAMVERLQRRWALDPLGRAPHGTARRWRYRDGGGVVAVIASITEPFCGDCNRLRITADGQAFTCLFASEGVDLRSCLAPSPDPAALDAALRALWRGRDDRFSERRAQLPQSAPHAEMAYLGG